MTNTNDSIPKPPHISVCIPTYKRPRMLAACIDALLNQESSGFTYSLAVADNDVMQSARDTVLEWRRKTRVEILYSVEPERNISCARNRALASSHGEFIAFIDDDEFPEPAWLQNMFNTYARCRVDGVLGPVLPFFEGKPPDWLVKSKLCVRSSFATGTPMTDPKHMRTGNVLFNRRIIEKAEKPFDPFWGRTGGEDAAFFQEMVARGFRFVWCNEGIVHELVPTERQKRSYLVQRAFIRGVTTADQERLLSLGTLKSIAAVSLYVVSLPILAIVGQHLFMRYFIRTCDHAAKLLAHIGIRLVRERTFS